jgi:hypothetical protein
MPRLYGHICANSDCRRDFTTAAAWAGNEGGPRYCSRKACLRLAGVPSAQLKRGRTSAAAAAPAVAHGLPPNATLVKVREILGQRYVNETELEEWQLENDIEEGDEEVEWQVQAKVARHERDKHGRITICWMTTEELQQAGDASSAKAALKEYAKRVAAEVKQALHLLG